MQRSSIESIHILKTTTKLMKAMLLATVVLSVAPTMVIAAEPVNLEKNYAVESGTLDSALNTFGLQSGINLLVDGALTKGKKSSGLKGSYSTSDAFIKLLQGTELTFNKLENGSYTLGEKRKQTFSKPASLGNIMVKGELQERSLQDSQTSAVVYSGVNLDQSTDLDLHDIIGRTPGIYTIGTDKGISIRGINEVRVSVDGQFAPNARANLYGAYSTWDMERVEILRGAQSTQSGRNALAGSVNLKTMNPTFNQEGKVRLDIGSKNTKQIAVAYNQPLIDEELAIRVAGQFSSTDGWVENSVRDEEDYDGRTLKNGRIKILYKPTKNLKAVLGYNYTDNRGGEDYVDYTVWDDNGKRDNQSDYKAEEGVIHKIATLNLDYSLSDQWSIISKTGHYQADYIRIEDIDNSSGNVNDGTHRDRESDASSLSQEISAYYQSKNINGVVGVYYTSVKATDNDFTRDRVHRRLPAGVTFYSLKIKESDVVNKAVFTEFDFDIGPSITLTVGARYDTESQKTKVLSENRLTSTGGLVPGTTLSSFEFDTDYNAFLPKLGLTYHINQNTSLGLTGQKGYKAGGANINPGTGVAYEYDPEYTTNLELAFRSVSASKDTVFNANLFQTEWDDMQVYVFGSANPQDFTQENAGSSSLSGAEVSLSHRLNDQFDFFINGSYLKTEYKKYETRGQDYKGNEFSSAPEYLASIGGNYSFSENWVLSADVNYQSDMFGDSANTDVGKIEGRTLVNAKFGYEANDWSAFLYSRNLTDQNYATQYSVKSGVRKFAKTGEPRFIGLQVNMDF